MAVFGDFGRFFGLGTAGETAESVGRALGITNPLTLDAIGTSAQKASDFVSIESDVSAPPAGVDSPATLNPVSQTSGFTSNLFNPGIDRGRGMMMQDPRQAFIGGLFPGAAGAAARLLSRPAVGGALGGAALGSGLDTIVDMFGNTKKLVITRKLQRDVKKVFKMSGGSFAFVSANSMRLFGKALSEDQIVEIMFRTFKNQGPFVTKAAVRKTRSTIRKMETLCDLKDRLCPPKRAAPRRRTMGTTTKVLQVK